MGYHHITDLNLSHHSFNNNAKPNSSSPLIIMPKPNNNTTTASSSAPSPYHGCPNPTTNLLALSDHADLVAANDVANVGSKGELSNEQQPLGSSRWNPTPEQLLALEELYRRGTRTPSAAQIQQIATRLRRFGKIEGKNVFYWFQNHKARERQKRRREVLETEHEQPKHQQCDTKSSEKKEPAGSSGYEIEETKDKVPPPNLCKLSEEFISTHGVAAESGPNEWIQIQDKELQQRNSTGRRSVSTWQACSPIYLINSLNSATSLAAKTALNAQTLRLGNITTLEDENREEQTLELFPLGSNYDRYKNGINISRKDTTQVPIRAINTSFTPNQYFEFLPLKN